MIVDEYGTVGYAQQEIVDHLHINPNFDIENLFFTDGEQYEASRLKTNLDVPQISLWNDRKYDIVLDEYHKVLQQSWLMPDNYAQLNIEEWLLEQCKTPEELKRVNLELELYRKYDLLNLLQYLKYLRNIADLNEIVWGVGRGSSCASYCLFLLRVHRVDSLKYGLDIKEFLRD